MVRFSEKETFKIIELYRQCECLWNVNNTNYKNRQVKQATCEAIAREMNIENFTAADVRAKIKSLRSTYKLELIKMKRFAEVGESFKSNIKWLSLMESIMEKRPSSVDNPSLENGEQTSEGIFPDDSQWEQQSKSSLEIASVNVSSAPSAIQSESEIEKSVKPIIDTEVIGVTPEIQSFQSVSNPDVYSVISEVQSVQPVSHSQIVTVTPEILTVKAVSSPETTVTSGIQQTVISVSDSVASSAPSGIQTVKSVSTPKFYALVPDIQTSKSVSNPRFVTVSAGNNQNVRYVSGSPGSKLVSEIQERLKKVSADETLSHRKRHHEEVSSTDSNNEFRLINNTKTVVGDFSDRSEDEMEAFGHFVALNLRKMSMQSALSAQSEILSVLTRYRLNDSATNLPSKQTIPCIVTNGSSPTQNPVKLQKLFLKS